MQKKGECLHEDRLKLKYNVFSKRLFSLTVAGILFFCFVAVGAASANNATNTTMINTTNMTIINVTNVTIINVTNVTSPSTETIPESAAIIAAIVILVAFALLIYVGVKADEKLNKGEMRRAIAGTFVVGFTVLMILSLSYDCSYQREIVMMYIELVGIIVGFYFGQRAAETKIEGGT